VVFLSFAYLDHDPALPDYENENNEAKEYDDRIAHVHVEPRGLRHHAVITTMCGAVVHQLDSGIPVG
jgi:hypothetical protein